MLAPLELMLLVLVIYLLPQYTLAGECLHHPLPLRLPVARNVRALRSGPVISVFGDEVRLDGVAVPSRENLIDGIETIRHVHPFVHEGAPLQWVLLQADRETPYAVLRPLLAVIAARGLAVDLVVERSGGFWLLDPLLP
jgi:hypothetical protein